MGNHTKDQQANFKTWYKLIKRFHIWGDLLHSTNAQQIFNKSSICLIVRFISQVILQYYLLDCIAFCMLSQPPKIGYEYKVKIEIYEVYGWNSNFSSSLKSKMKPYWVINTRVHAAIILYERLPKANLSFKSRKKCLF